MILSTSKILYPNNIEKSITDVNVSDFIIGYDEDTKEFVNVKVLAKKSKEYNQIIEIIFTDDTKLEITEEHPIYSKNGWVSYNTTESKRVYKIDCAQIKEDDFILTKDKTYKTVKSINIINKSTTVYTLNVTDSVDTYVVDEIVVHNRPMEVDLYLLPTNVTNIEYKTVGVTDFTDVTSYFTLVTRNSTQYLYASNLIYDDWHSVEHVFRASGCKEHTLTSNDYDNTLNAPLIVLEKDFSAICTRDQSKDIETPIIGRKRYVFKSNGKYYDIRNPFVTYTLTINPTPSDATVVLTADGYTQVGNTISVRKNTTVHYTVSKTDYYTSSGDVTITKDESKSIVLDYKYATLTINPTPSDVTVVLTATGYTQSGNSITVEKGTEVSWTVSKEEYITMSGNQILNDNETKNIELLPVGYILFESDIPGTYDYTLNRDGVYKITIIGAGGGGCGQGAKGSSYSAASGSGGAVYICEVSLNDGSNINCVVGAGGQGKGGGDYTGTAGTGEATVLNFNSTLIATCNGGGGGQTWFRGGSANNPGGDCIIDSQTTYLTNVLEAKTGPLGTNGASSGTYFYCDPPTELGDYGRGGRGMGRSSGYEYEGQDGFNGYCRIQIIG